MADAYGLNDYSLLSGQQQDTARTIQRAFDASLAGRNRALERYNLQTMGPMLTEFANDSALRRAQTTAGILNNNQQLQQLIDESHRSPHGLAENLSAYLPALGGLARLYPALFGTNTGLAQNGIIPTAWGGLKSAYSGLQGAITKFTNPADGMTYHLDANGNVISYGMQDRGIGDLSGFGSWTSGSDLPMGDGWNTINTDWTSGFDLGNSDWTSGFDLDWGF